MTLQEITELSRSEQVLMNIYSHQALFPRTAITAIVIESFINNYVFRVFYENTKNGKRSVHSFSVYRPGEADEAKKCIEMLEATFGIEVTGNIE